jgi:hypothetical protein
MHLNDLMTGRILLVSLQSLDKMAPYEDLHFSLNDVLRQALLFGHRIIFWIRGSGNSPASSPTKRAVFTFRRAQCCWGAQ